MAVPVRPKIYHIVHVDRLSSIIEDGYLWCDAEIVRRSPPGTTIGMNSIKERRLQLTLTSHSDLHVGDCVPFYFCPRSIMLYLIYRGNHLDLTYRGGQRPLIHLVADLYTTVEWAEQNQKRWAFTLSNAGSSYFEDRCNLAQLNEVGWDDVQSNQWGSSGVLPSIKDGKQAEFLLEYSFPWHLVECIGVYSRGISSQIDDALPANGHCPQIDLKRDWYY